MTDGLSRRVFLAATGATSLALLVGCGGGSGPSVAVDETKAVRLSTRKVSGASTASKLNAANKLFVSAAAASLGRAHPGDKARIVTIDISPATWQLWFGDGTQVVDLRHPPDPVAR